MRPKLAALPIFVLAGLAATLQARADDPKEWRPGGSQEVLYNFPRDAEQISVGRTGELTFGLEVPSFPGYLQPQLVAHYDSRGGDGPMGMGWQLAVPNVTLDLSDTTDAASTTPDSNYLTSSGKSYLAGRWIANPGGKLVCERNGTGTAYTDYRCVTSPRTPLQFAPSGGATETSFTARDPYEGTKQIFGGRNASRILDDTSRVVAFLLDEEQNLDGKRVRHFYEERRGHDERLRTAVLVGSDKVIRFVYTPRASNVLSSYRLGARRTTENLLTEIDLLDGCVPVQIDNDPNDIWTDFSSCQAARLVEKVVLTYKDPANRYTGRYVLGSWRHTSGDGTVSYRAVSFDYNGDTNPARGDGTTTSNVASRVYDRFNVPAGFTLATSSLNAPFQTYMDWNRDGLADWIESKNEETDYTPTPYTVDHSIYVHPRNASGGFDARQAFADPFATRAAWLWKDSGDLFIAEAPVDNLRSFYWNNLIQPRDLDDYIGDSAQFGGIWTDATIGINTRPFIYDPSDCSSSSDPSCKRSVPLAESLSITVPCDNLGYGLCEAIKTSYKCVWEGECDDSGGVVVDTGSHDYGFNTIDTSDVAVKLADLVDMDGDGYLDRVVSGLIVIYDPQAPDADVNGMRSPTNGDPCVYVSRFDPGAGEFGDFRRYSIAGASSFPDLSSAFLSALGVEVTYNQQTSTGDMSNMGTVAAASSAIGLSLDVYGVAKSFPNPTASFFSNAMGALDLGVFALSSVSRAAHELGASPEITAELNDAVTAAGFMQRGVGIATAAARVAHASEIAAKTGITTTAAHIAGWASLTVAAVGAVAAVVNYSINQTAREHMTATGYNAAAVAAHAKTLTSIVTVVSSSIIVAASTVALIAGSSGNPAGWVVGIVAGLVALGDAIYELLVPDGEIDWYDGDVSYKVHEKRGIEYTSGTDTHEYTSQQVLGWMDVTGDGRVDLVVGKYSPTEEGFAVAPANVTEGVTTLETQTMRDWQFGSSAPPMALSSSYALAKYAWKTVHRADEVDTRIGMADINGDGLADVIDTRDTAPSSDGWSPVVYLNTGRGFAAATTWKVEGGSASVSTTSCTTRPKLARSRALSWTEFVSTTEGYGISLSNVTQMLGPDLDMNGLPDLVLKDELEYDYMNDGGACNEQYGSGVCDAALPVWPEPNGKDGDGTCGDTWASDLWFANNDGLNNKDGVREGASHLSLSARDIYSPHTKGYHYVAFNTGKGFTRFVKIATQLPSLSGGFAYVDTTNHDLPQVALNGTSNFLADPDARGQMDLIALDIHDSDIQQLDGNTPVYGRWRFGIQNPDALIGITYPEGGTVSFSYAQEKQVQGVQGPPLWVLANASFDDKIESSYGGPPHTIDYGYTGGRLEGREFLGFAAIGETRFTGDDFTQVIQSYEQSGATRGAILCTEVRGRRAESNEKVGQYVTHPTCSEDQLSGTPAGADDTQVVDSCVARAAARLDLGTLYPLVERQQFVYDPNDSVSRTNDDGSSADLLRDFQMQSLVTQVWNGTTRHADTTLEVSYDPPPYDTPTLSKVTTSDGKSRSLESAWRHVDADWVFLKERETKRTGAGALALESRTQHAGAAPYHLTRIDETDGTTTRTRTYDSYDTGGMPTAVTEAGRTTRYTYYANGLVETIRRPTDAYEPAAGTERYTYDARGRVLTHDDAAARRTTTTYDALGVLATVTRPGERQRVYTYFDVGNPGASRTRAALGSTQRTVETVTLDAESLSTLTYWDGFYRRYRDAKRASGSRTIAMDFDADGGIDRSVTYTGDDDWFTSHAAMYLARDYRVAAPGEVQCESMPYVDEGTPAGWKTTLYDPLRRVAYEQDFEHFGVATEHGISSAGRQTVRRVDSVGGTSTVELDGLGRRASEDRSGLLSFTYRHGDWDGLERITDGLGFVRIQEHNGWNQSTKDCAQATAGPVPATNVCPTGWPARATTYDAAGQVATTKDPLGQVMTYTGSVCGKPGRTSYPSASSSDATLTSDEVMTFDPTCREIRRKERNGSLTVTSYDAGGRMSKVTAASGLPEEATLRYGYDGLGRKLWSQDGNGHRTYQIAELRDQPVATYGPEGVINQTEYDVWGHVISTTDGEGGKIKLENDRMGRPKKRWTVAEVCDIASFGTRLGTVSIPLYEVFGRDAKGRMTSKVGADGSLETYVYDLLDRKTRAYATSLTTPGAIDPGVYQEWGYDAAGHLVTDRDYGGHTTELVPDGLGRIVEMRVPSTSSHKLVTRYKYDDASRLTRVDSPNAASASACVTTGGGPLAYTTRYTYNPLGQVETVTEPADASGARNVTRTSYDRAGDVASTTDERGYTTSYARDALHHMTRRTAPDLTVESWSYDDAGNPATYTDARALVTVYDHDGQNRLTKVTPPSGVATVYGYDRRGLETFEAGIADLASSTWEATHYTYYADGAQASTSKAVYSGATPTAASLTDLSTARVCHDNARRPLASQDPDGNISQVRYDTRGRRSAELLTPVYGGGWETLSYTRDDDGLVTRIDAPMGGTTAPATVVTTYGYDLAHRRTGETFSQAAHARAFTFDDDGNVCRAADMSGTTVARQVSTTYDERGLPLARALTPGATESFTYDAAGNMLTAVDGSGSWGWDYDNRNRIQVQRQRVARLGTTFTTDYDYAANGLLEWQSYPAVAGFTAGPAEKRLTLDAATNRPAEAATDLDVIASGISYDGRDRPLGLTYGNGAVLAASYDLQGGLATKAITYGPTTQMSLQVHHDSAGNVTQLDDLLAPSFTTQLFYDTRNRLAKAYAPALGGWWKYKMNSQDLMDVVTGPVAAKNQTFRYDARGNLSRLDEGGTGFAFSSDAWGNRFTTARKSQRYVYDALNRLERVLDGSGALLSKNVYAFDGRRVEAGDRVFLYGLERMPLAEVTLDATGKPAQVKYDVYLGEELAQSVDGASGATRFFGTNHQGSPVLSMGAAGAPYAHRAYDPFGKEMPWAAGPTLDSEVGFQSNFGDDLTALSLMHHRYYDPDTYAFISPDPKGLRAGKSRFAFAEGSPQGFTDRFGHDEDVAPAPDFQLAIQGVTDPEVIKDIESRGLTIVPLQGVPGMDYIAVTSTDPATLEAAQEGAWLYREGLQDTPPPEAAPAPQPIPTPTTGGDGELLTGGLATAGGQGSTYIPDWYLTRALLFTVGFGASFGDAILEPARMYVDLVGNEAEMVGQATGTFDYHHQEWSGIGQMAAQGQSPDEIATNMVAGIVLTPARMVDDLANGDYLQGGYEAGNLVQILAPELELSKGPEVPRCAEGVCSSGFECFVAGTPVVTADGERPIESIRAGDRVLARDAATGETAVREVVRRFVTPGKEVLRLTVRSEDDGVSETLGVTPGHPFRVAGRGWVGAGELAVGDELESAGGGRLRVAAVERTGERETVYNFEVEGVHTYFVGQLGTWVHNACGRGRGGYGPRQQIGKAIEVALGDSMKAMLGDRVDTQTRIPVAGETPTGKQAHTHADMYVADLAGPMDDTMGKGTVVENKLENAPMTKNQQLMQAWAAFCQLSNDSPWHPYVEWRSSIIEE